MPVPPGADAAALELPMTLSWTEVLGTTTAEQAKTILAGIGLLCVVVFALRTLVALQARPESKRRR